MEALELRQQLSEVQDSVLCQTSSKTYTKHLITAPADFDALCTELNQQKLVCFDVETNGTFDRFKVALVGLGLCWNDTDTYYIPLNHNEGRQLPLKEVISRTKGVLEDVNVAKLAHNAKFDEMIMELYGVKMRGICYDTMVAAWMLDDVQVKKLKVLVKKYCDYQMETYEEVVDSVKHKRGEKADHNFAKVSLEHALSYAADDPYWTLQLHLHFKKLLEAEGLWEAYNNIDAPFVRVTRRIEGRGVFIDQDELKAADEKLPKLLEEVDASIYEQAGVVFNIQAPQQLGKVLFETLRIQGNGQAPTTAAGNYSTDKDVLKKYAKKHKIVRDIQRRKKIQKTNSLFVQGSKKFLSPDGRIHCNFNGIGTRTGRLSSSKPNLQQIIGEAVEEVKIRNFFIPPPDYQLIVGDYSQVELRLMAHFAKDENMIAAFNSGRDFHEETARRMFYLTPDQEVLPRQRFAAKAINFGIGYGRGVTSIAEQIGCTMKEAQAYIDDWEKAFPMVIKLRERTVANCRKTGYVRTISGRKRRLPLINSSIWKIRGNAERQAFNTKIQGSAADLIKIAMISLSETLPEYDAHMCIQVHDELVTEAPTDRAEEVREVIKQTMMFPLNGKNPLMVPLEVDPVIVGRWADGK